MLNKEFLYLPSPWYSLIFYWVWILFFHFGEGLTTWIYRRSQFSFSESFLISWRYILFLVCTMLEFCLEAVFWPESKGLVPCIIVGSVIFLLFWALRVAAIMTAGKSFNHSIDASPEDHRLVTHGIYRWIRHPSYLGYFGIVIGTQVVISTPGTFVIGVILTWLFFYFRIPLEEAELIERHREYLEYQNTTFGGIPFIS